MTYQTWQFFKETYVPITNPWMHKNKFSFDRSSTPADLIELAQKENRLWTAYIGEADNGDEPTFIINGTAINSLAHYITEKPGEGEEVLLSVRRVCEDCEDSGEECQSCDSRGGTWIDVSTQELIVQWEDSV